MLFVHNKHHTPGLERGAARKPRVGPALGVGMQLAILNTSILTTDGEYRLRTISLDEALKLVESAEGLDSAVGHASTAQMLTELLGMEVPVNRQLFSQKVGQQALVFKMMGRPEEGKILTRAEIEAMGYELKLLERIA